MVARRTATVAGAGALGLACALALADAGFEVTVCDPAAFCANASGVAAGMLAPVFEAVLDGQAAAHADLLLAARDLWPALEARSGVRVDRSGALAAGSEGWLASIAAAMGRLGHRATEVPRITAEALAPGLAPDLPAFLLNREDWRIDAQAALTALRAAAEAAGVRFLAEPAPHRPDGLLVIATGAGRDLADVAPELACLEPIKGHILRAEAPGVGGVTVRGEGGYVSPTDGGALAIGATMEPGVSDPTPDPAKAPALVAVGAALFPALAAAPHELAAGVRAATPDGLPLVGFSGAAGVLMAVGARRNGWLLAPMAARIVAACAVGADPGAHGLRLDPQRFG